jgi:hypothetical protein
MDYFDMRGECLHGRCLFESGNRDFTIDAIVASIVAMVLLFGIILCGFYTFSYKSTMIQPEMNVRDAYIKATIIFARLFQRPPQRHNFSAFTRTLIANRPHYRPNKLIMASTYRSSRNLGDSSFAFDLTNETTIFYCGTLFKFSNNIVAQHSHLEYCFESVLPPTPGDSPRTLNNLKLAYLPTIKESKSLESISTKSVTFTPRESFMRPRVRREILLFTGPEHRREWLPDESGDEDHDDDFHWAFEEASSVEEDALSNLPPTPRMVGRLMKK